jgi:hypothetical protein
MGKNHRARRGLSPWMFHPCNYASIPYNQVAPVRKEKVIHQVLEGVREFGIML